MIQKCKQRQREKLRERGGETEMGRKRVMREREGERVIEGGREGREGGREGEREI